MPCLWFRDIIPTNFRAPMSSFFCLYWVFPYSNSSPILKHSTTKPLKILSPLPPSMYSLSPCLSLSCLQKSYLQELSIFCVSNSTPPIYSWTHSNYSFACVSIKTVLIKSIYDFLIAKSNDWFLVLMLFVLLAAFDIIYYFLLLELSLHLVFRTPYSTSLAVLSQTSLLSSPYLPDP